MNKIEFLSQLEQCLQGLPFEERLEALNYYKGYIEDAGPERETQAIEELGSPESIAHLLKQQNGDISHEGMAYDRKEDGIYTEEGYRGVDGYPDKKELVNITESYDEKIHSIDIKVYVGTVKVVKGTEFQIVANNVENHQFHSAVEDGVWKIQDADGTFIRAVSSKISSLFHGKPKECYPDITIYIPTGFAAEQMNLYVGAGVVSLEDLVANQVKFSVNAGKLTGERILVKEHTDISINTGETKLNQISATDVTLKCNVGNMEYNGSMIGDNIVNCNIGCIRLGLNARAEEYEYNIGCALGEILIDGINYKQFQEQMKQQSKGFHSLKLHCDIGSIIVKTGGK